MLLLCNLVGFVRRTHLASLDLFPPNALHAVVGVGLAIRADQPIVGVGLGSDGVDDLLVGI